MISTHGDKVVVDSDALIGLIHEDDALHNRCLIISNYLTKNSFATIIPFPIILEASTTLSRAAKRADLSKKLLVDYSKIAQPALNEKGLSNLTAKSFDPRRTKKNTPFDHYLASLAKLNNIKFVFSFDSFYEKQGLILIENRIEGSDSG